MCATAAAQDAERSAAVKLAREGQLEPAIAALEDLHRRYPGDIATAADLVTVLTWAGRNREALAVFDAIGAERAPYYAIEAAARAARNLGELARADADLALGLVRFPADRSMRALRVLVLTDAQRFEEARALFWPLLALDPQNVETLMAGAYLHAQSLDWGDSLRFYDEVLRQEPENLEALRGRALALSALRAPYQARALASETPGVLDAGTAARLEGTRTAMRLRWGELPNDDPAVGRAEIDRAIATLEAKIAELRAQPAPDPIALRRARIDLLVAYRNRSRMTDAVAVYEGLVRDGVTVPAYGRRSAAAAYLYLQKPEEAEALYRGVLAEEPDDLDTQFAQLGLFYSLIEQERYGDAYALIDALDKAEPPFREYPGSGGTFENPRKLEVAVPAALARYYGDQLGEAWARVSALADAAPAAVWLQGLKATVARARGWPRAALDIIEPWRTLGVDDTGLEVERAQALMDLSRYDEADPVIARLAARYPESKDVQDLMRRWDAYRSWELETRTDVGKGTEPTNEGTELTVATRLYSPPVGYHWRFTLGYAYTFGDVQEGKVDLHRSSIGAEYRGPGLWAYGELADIAGTLNRLGGRLAAVFTPDDHWYIRASGEIFAQDTPLRAIKTGVTANSGGAGLTYRWHESRDVDVGWRFMGFSDGNDRHEVNLALAQRLIDVPRFDLIGRLEFYGSTNSQSDGAYFSPEWIASPAVTLIGEHVAWRRYRTSFVHALTVTVGATAQKGFDTKPIATASYEHRWRWDPRFELVYGVRGGSRVFDGDREQEYGGFFAFRGRF
jgi:biofilm PGA synthesis protein PgaA